VTLLSRSTPSAFVLLAVVVTVALALIVASTGRSSSADATGVFEVEGARYEFVPTACTTTDTDFVAAGTGKADGQAFWVSATSRSMTLTVGTESEVERPDDDQLWLTSLGSVNWWAVDGGIEAQAVMVDSRSDTSPRRPATLLVRCPDSATD
jgi:hypothetical protein